MKSIKLLSDITVYLKYSKWDTNLKRKENWNELVYRNKNMHVTKFKNIIPSNNPFWKKLDTAYTLVKDKKILPSMRSLQMAGEAINRNNSRMYNCSYIPINDMIAFKEVLYLLLCGCGVGYSVQGIHVEKLPKIYKPTRSMNYYIQDSIEGWADALEALLDSFTRGTPLPIFKGDLVRKKGSIISSVQALAPGPESLLKSLDMIRDILNNKENGTKLRPIEVMDIINIASECVISGGVRRSALICLFSPYDDEMCMAKSGSWYIDKPWRARSNNSAVILRGGISEKSDFDKVWSALKNSGSGEPAPFFTNDLDVGTNPCGEISLRPYTYCNLTEINGSTITSQQDFNNRAYYASFLGTLQASYNKFSYLRPEWTKNTMEDSLIGVGITGICSGGIFSSHSTYDTDEAARSVVDANQYAAKLLGINVASRTTTIKPSGTSSLVLGSSSGIHAVHSPYYIRHIRINKDESMYKYLVKAIPELVEDDVTKQDGAVIKIPQKMIREGAVYRNENVFSFLERVKYYNQKWIKPGHLRGVNNNNVSATCSIKFDEWDAVGQWMYKNRHTYSGIACLPYSDHVYKQAPFEEIDRQTYLKLYKNLKKINLDEIHEKEKLMYADELEPACSGGICDIVKTK